MLLIAFGSEVPADTVPVVHTDPRDDRHGTEMVTLTCPPTGIAAHEHDTTSPLTVQFPPEVASVDGAGPLNRLDDASRATFWLSLGPRLATTSVNVAVPLPALPDVKAVWLRARSARVRTVPHVWEVLLPGVGSDVVEVADAVLHSWLDSPAEGRSLMVRPNAAVALGASVAVVQVIPAGPTVPTAGLVHVHPAGAVTAWKDVPAGIVSDIERLPATLGPWFATTIE